MRAPSPPVRLAVGIPGRDPTSVVQVPDLALAPMDGISDAIVRDLLAALGGMDLCVTEFVRVTSGPVSRKVLLRDAPELETGGRTPSGTPVMIQLLGGDAASLAETARRCAEMGAYGIDLNFGCPARRVNGHDGGATLLRAPRRVAEVVRACRRSVPDDRPVSAKIRLGWDDPDAVDDLVRAAAGGGATWITVHGRTKVQMYDGRADWRRIGRAAAQVGTPVVANGDLFDPDALERCRAVTGCQSFMLGRGAFRTPNLFRWIRRWDPGPWPPHRSVALLHRFIERVLSDPRFDRPEKAALGRLKQWVRALAERDPAFATAFQSLKHAPDLESARRHLEPLERGSFEVATQPPLLALDPSPTPPARPTPRRRPDGFGPRG